MSLNMDNMEINTDPSWRNILLTTICVASAAIYFFFFSHDRKFIIKTMFQEELDIMMENLPLYFDHINDNP